MKLPITTYLFIALGTALSVVLNGQAFPCDGSFYISLNDPTSNGPTTFYRIEADGSSVNFIEITSVTGIVNGIAFNPFDNFIYGLESNLSNDLIRVKSDGTWEVAYTFNSFPVWFGSGSDMRFRDTTFISHNTDEDRLYFLNLNTYTLSGTVPLSWDPSSGNSGTANIWMDDIAVDPTDPGTLYTYQRNYVNGGEPASTRGHLLKVDIDSSSPTFGYISAVGPISASVALHFGSFFFDHNGQLFGYGSIIPPPVQQRRFIKIDKATAMAELVAQGPVATGNDGCYCPFYIDLEKVVIQENRCDTAFVTFELNLINNSFEDVSGLTIRDTLPDGFFVIGVTPEHGNIGGLLIISDTPPIVTLANASLPAGSQATFQIQTYTLTSGSFQNQAWIEDLPGRYGGMISSDDPTTDAFNDAVKFFVDIQYSVSIGMMDTTLCSGEQIVINGQPYDSSGLFEQVLPGAAIDGCDSLLQITVTLEDPSTHDINAMLCEGEMLTINGKTYTEAGTYSDIIPNGAANGCDSVLFINITGGNTSSTSVDAILCPGKTILINGTIYNTPGNYIDTIPGGTFRGCDSILIIEITAGNSAFSSIEKTICRGDDIDINGISYSTPGTYEELIEGGAANGCDSLLEIVIHEIELSAGMVNVMICAGDTFTLHGSAYSSTTEDTVVLSHAASNGCDSLLYLRIEMHPMFQFQYQPQYDLSIGDTAFIEIQTDSGHYDIEWEPDAFLSCSSCLNLWATPSSSTFYNFNITDVNGCEGSGTVWINIDAPDIDIYIPNIFSPNNDGLNDWFTIYGVQIAMIDNFTIFDRWGEVVWESGPFLPNVSTHGWDGSWHGLPMQSGVYVYKATVQFTNGDTKVLAGDITLVR